MGCDRPAGLRRRGGVRAGGGGWWWQRRDGSERDRARPRARPRDPTLQAATVPAVTLHLVASGLSQPLGVTAPPGDTHRLFVVRKTGPSASSRTARCWPGRSSTSPVASRAAASRACCPSPSIPTTRPTGASTSVYTNSGRRHQGGALRGESGAPQPGQRRVGQGAVQRRPPCSSQSQRGSARLRTQWSALHRRR